MTRAEAEVEARRRNLEDGLSDRFWIEVERSDGSWDLELRSPEGRGNSKKSTVFQSIVEALTWW